MEENIVVTNEDVLWFYADKGEEGCELTEKYISRNILDEEYRVRKCYRSSNAYVKLAETFQKGGEEGEEEDRSFYQWLMKQNYSEMLSLSALMKRDKSFETFIKQPAFIKRKDNPTVLIEKWHLYISWYALEEYWYKKKEKNVENQWFKKDKYSANAKEDASGILNKARCHSLLLWMYETSKPDKESDIYIEIKNRVSNEIGLKDLEGKLKNEIIENIWKWKMNSQTLKNEILSPTCTN